MEEVRTDREPIGSSSSASSGFLDPLDEVNPESEAMDIDEQSIGMRLRKMRNNRRTAEEIIQLEDSDELSEDQEETKKTEGNSTGNISDYFKLFEFPLKSKEDNVAAKYSVTVCLVDLKTLEYETFLNDIVIDFYLTYLQHEMLPHDDRGGVHIFSTMFYLRLTSDTKPKKKGQIQDNSEQKLTAAERRHFKVKGWTKNVNIFDKDLIIIPICEHSHWFLIVVVKPGLVSTLGNINNNGEPLILVLDSMGGNKSTAVRYIREYLSEEWSDRS